MRLFLNKLHIDYIAVAVLFGRGACNAGAVKPALLEKRRNICRWFNLFVNQTVLDRIALFGVPEKGFKQD